MSVTPNRRLIPTLASIANVTTPPGSSRTIQSKMSKGANGSPNVFQPRNETATSAVVSTSPDHAPCAGVVLRGGGSLRCVDVCGTPARANGRHIRIDDGRQVQRDELRDDQPA